MLATGIIVAGGTAAYMQSRSRVRRPNGTGHHNGLGVENEVSEELDVVGNNNNTIIKKGRQKKGLKSLQVLAAILLSHMGRMGARDLLALLAVVVSLFFNQLPRSYLCIFSILYFDLEAYINVTMKNKLVSTTYN